MSNTVIRVENVSKQYRLGTIGTGTLSSDLKRWYYNVRGKEDPFLKIGEENDRTKKGNSEYVWALKDISFDIKQGDVVGIIGRNGAGKSTLLKILSRTTLPTSGSVKVKGRIASLLEVGTGFHPELSGKENIFLNGAILGMTKHEIKSKFDEIVEFAGIERYIETPVKRYSSGMYVRLAFAVAAYLDPEILIVDEVLAVGDAEFQKKALGKMNDVSRTEGRTVLFVSHNIGAIRTLCQSGILLNNGLVEKAGPIEEVIQHYFQRGHQRKEKPLIDSYRTNDISKSPVIVEDVFVKDQPYFPSLPIGIEPQIIVRVKCRQKISDGCVTVALYNSEGINLGIAFSWDDNFSLSIEEGVHDVTLQLKNFRLSPGHYFIGIGLNQSATTMSWDGIRYYPIFSVENQSNVTQFAHRSWGVNHFSENYWSIEKVSNG
jgi:lipopolysaccharide transport system ATP-binding protein